MEMFRVLKPGGQVNGFEVPYERNPLERFFYILWNNWNADWHDGPEANQGPEPYIGEYENGVRLPDYMKQIGFKEVQEVKYSYFESIFKATKSLRIYT